MSIVHEKEQLEYAAKVRKDIAQFVYSKQAEFKCSDQELAKRVGVPRVIMDRVKNEKEVTIGMLSKLIRGLEGNILIL